MVDIYNMYRLHFTAINEQHGFVTEDLNALLCVYVCVSFSQLTHQTDVSL